MTLINAETDTALPRDIRNERRFSSHRHCRRDFQKGIRCLLDCPARNMQKGGGGLYAALCSYRDMVLPRRH